MLEHYKIISNTQKFNDKILAIKALRQLSGYSLSDAKMIVEGRANGCVSYGTFNEFVSSFIQIVDQHNEGKYIIKLLY